MTMRQLLLNPGPVVLSPRVRAALADGDCCHREPEFADLTRRVLVSLREVYDADDYTAVLMAGSGTCAVEAMLASIAPRDSRTLVIDNGVYGDRMAAMLRAQGKPLARQSHDWEDGIDLDAGDALLYVEPDISHVAAVHHETTTGRLNDIDGLGSICRRRNVRLLLDAVSSFGAEAIDPEGWNLAALAGTANKCLHGAPGACFVLARTERLERGRTNAASVYLDLFRYYREQQSSGYSPFTPAVNSVFALAEALAELSEEGGWQARRETYLARMDRIAAAVGSVGVEPLMATESVSCVLRAYRLPEGISYDEMHDRLRDRGIVIYAGQGGLADRVFRIACMGDLTGEDMGRIETGLVDVLGGRRE
jgi:2-aminoethylphosphonate-pyruvate transaminase